MHHLHFQNQRQKLIIHPFLIRNRRNKLTSQHHYNMCHNQEAIMDQLKQNQVVLYEELSQVRAQMGQLMETIQVFTQD